jgi:hypothetical protein
MSEQLIVIASVLFGVAILSAVALRAWQDWLALKRCELDRGTGPQREIEGGAGMGAARIEIADLKERIRKLEAIASGVDL